LHDNLTGEMDNLRLVNGMLGDLVRNICEGFKVVTVEIIGECNISQVFQ